MSLVKGLDVSWSYRIATVRGIPLKVHVTFAVILFIVAANWSGLGVVGVGFGVLLVTLLFGCVTLHEFGHAIAAQRFGIPVREVMLLPIGGIAVLGRNTRNPVHEFVIAAAGPLVNVVIVAILAGVLLLWGQPLHLGASLIRPEANTIPSVAEVVRWLLGVNIGLVLFNLIPAFPLDGGRILRGLLGLKTDWMTATRWATATGQWLAIGMGVIAVLDGRLVLALIAALVFFAAGATHAEERSHRVLAGEKAGDACNRHALALSERDRLGDVVRYLLTSYQPDFAVLRGNVLLGVVVRADVLKALAQHRSDVLVTTMMASCPHVNADLTLAEVRTLLEEHAVSVAAVHDASGFIGLISREDMQEAELVLAFARAGIGGLGKQPFADRRTPVEA